jgi:hypothetical protein
VVARVARVHAVNKNLPAFRQQQRVQQPGQGAFPGPIGADDGGEFSRLHLEMHIAQRRAVLPFTLGVGKRNVLYNNKIGHVPDFILKDEVKGELSPAR